MERQALSPLKPIYSYFTELVIVNSFLCILPEIFMHIQAHIWLSYTHMQTYIQKEVCVIYSALNFPFSV